MFLVAKQQQKTTFLHQFKRNYKIEYFERLKMPLRSM